MQIHNRLSARLFTPLLLATLLFTSCGGGGGGGGVGSVGSGSISVYASGAALRALTGEADVVPGARVVGENGDLYFFDSISGAVIRVDSTGTAEVHATAASLAGIIPEEMPVTINSMDCMIGGQLDGQIICGTEAGAVIRIQQDGTTEIHSTTDQLNAAVADAGPARLPTYYDVDQVLIQVEEGSMLLIDAAGVASVLATSTAIKAVTGSDSGRFFSSIIVRSPSTGTVFVRTGRQPLSIGSLSTFKILRIATNGDVSQAFDPDDVLQATGHFPDTIQSLTPDPDSDRLLAVTGGLFGNTGAPLTRWIVALEPSGELVEFFDITDHIAAVTRGSGWVFSGPSGSISDADRIFLGNNMRFEDFGLLQKGTEVLPFALERFLTGVLSFDSFGVPTARVQQPTLFNLFNQIVDISSDFGAAPLPDLGVLLFEQNTDTLILLKL